jgi:hypothetical protein
MRGTVAKRMRAMAATMVANGHRQYDGLRARQVKALLTRGGVDYRGLEVRRLAGRG